MDKVKNIFSILFIFMLYQSIHARRLRSSDQPSKKEVSIVQATKKGNRKEVIRFLAKGHNVNNIYNGKTLLHYAALKGNNEMVELLINAGARVDTVDEFGESALHYAVCGQACDVVETLLERGANPNLKNKENISPILISFEKGYKYIAKVFLSYADLAVLPELQKYAYDNGWLDLWSVISRKLAQNGKLFTNFNFSSSKNNEKVDLYDLQQRTVGFLKMGGSTILMNNRC